MPWRWRENSPSDRAWIFLPVGAYALLIQILLVRECFLLFTGNELCIALQLGMWLLLTAAGGAIGAALPDRAAIILLICLPLFGLWAVAVVRFLPPALPVPVGQEMPFGWALMCLALAQAPLNLASGALFPTGSRLIAPHGAPPEVGRNYGYEALGATLAGLVFTFALAGRARGPEVAAGASAVFLLFAAAFLRRFSATASLLALIVGMIAGVACLRGRLSQRADDFWWTRRQPGSVRLATLETRHQRLDIGLRSGQRTIFSNGAPMLTLEDVEEVGTGYRMADLYMSLHPAPRRICIIGCGEPGLPRRILEYPVESVTYVLQDTALLEAMRALSGEGGSPWDQGRLCVRVDDGRRFLRESRSLYDLILLDLPSPTTAAGNRFFTLQAFEAARLRLREGGMLVLCMPSSAHYLAGDSERLLASIHRAMLKAFGAVEIVAGDNMIFIGSRGPIGASLEGLAGRFAERGPPLRLGGDEIADPNLKRAAFAALFEDQFDVFRRAMQMPALQRVRIPANDDARPIAYYLNLRKWIREIGLGALLNDDEEASASRAGRSHWLGVAMVMACVGVAAFLLTPRQTLERPGTRRTLLSAAILTSGWAGMIGETTLVFAYQNRFGQIYHEIGALMATYMAALALGSALTGKRCGNPLSRWNGLLLARGLMIVSCAAAIAAFGMSSAWAIFGALFFYAFALGMEYPLANEVYQLDLGGWHGPGILHAADHLGGALATFVGATLLMPLVGARVILWTAAAIHVTILISIARARSCRAK